jgi:hypothetical protein
MVALLLVAAIVFTWGSIGSMICVYCLITLCAALLFQKFMTNRDPDDFDME